MHWKMCFTRNRTSLSNPWLEEWIRLSFGIDWTQSKRSNKWRYRGFTHGPNVWLWYQVMRLRQTGNWCDHCHRVSTCYCNDVNQTSLTLNYSKSFQDAPYSDLWTQHREQHTTSQVHPRKAPPSRLTVSVCLVPSGALRWHLQLLRGKRFGERRSLSPLCPSSPASPVFGTWKAAHLFPLTVLVQHDDHQSGMHLVAFLSEGQVFAIPRHIDHESGERKRERQMFRGKSKRFQTNERTPPSV